MNNSDYKKNLRKLAFEMRKKKDKKMLANLSMNIQEELIKTEAWQNSLKPALYSPLPFEVSTKNLYENAWQFGKTLLLPVITSLEHRQMQFYSCDKFDELKPGPMNILQPPIQNKSQIPDLVILPGLLFSKNGFRLGYGGGFYDCYLADKNIMTIGLCFSFQIIENINPDIWDKPINRIITEEGVVY